MDNIVEMLEAGADLWAEASGGDYSEELLAVGDEGFGLGDRGTAAGLGYCVKLRDIERVLRGVKITINPEVVRGLIQVLLN